MANVEYDVVYVARIPASLKQDEFASLVDEMCNGRAAGGWRLVSTVGDYGAVVTLGVWLIFAREAGAASEQPVAEADTSGQAEPDLELPKAMDERERDAGDD